MKNNPWKSGTIYLLMAVTVIFLLTCVGNAVSQIPQKTNKFVNDYANVIDDNLEENLNVLCKSIEQESTSQVVVITSNDMPMDLEISEWSLRIAESWGIGQKGNDNGVLILILPNAHKSRIEVGYGLEGILTDAYTSRVQREMFNPNFRNGDFYTGISLVLQEIKKEISPEAIEQRKQQQLQKEKEARETAAKIGDFFLNLLIYGIFLGLVGMLIYYVIKEQRKKAEKIKQELERVRREEARIKAEEDRVIRNAEESKKRFIETATTISQKLSQLGNFMNASDLLKQVSDIHQNGLANEPELFKDYTQHFEPKTYQIKNLTKDILEKNEIAKSIVQSAREWVKDSESIQKKIAHSKTTYHSLRRVYDQNIFSKVPNFNQDAEGFYSSIQLFFEHALNSLKDNDFINAQKHHNHAKKQIEAFEAYAVAVSICETNIQNAHNILNSANDVYLKLLREADHIYRDSDIDTSTLRKYKSFRNEASETLNVNLRSMDPISEADKAINLHELLKSFIKLAKNDIEVAKKKRDEEERRRRRKREEEEDDRRRNSYATGAAIGFGSSSSSSSSSDDSSFSSGGGSFGGGGSDNSW